MTTKTFLVEIGTEELPPKSLKGLAQSFAANLSHALQQLNINYKDVQWFAAPRRLAVKIAGLQTHQPDTSITKRGPALAQAFNAEAQPTPAALGWARGCGIDINAAERLVTDKGEWLTYTLHQSGQAVENLLVDLVTQALNKLPINKPMRWGNKNFSFIRPIHSATLLYGDAVISGEILGITIDRCVQGHRFMGESWVSLPDADSYPSLLETAGKVMADYQQRQAKIVADSQAIAEKLGAVVELDPALLDEVTALVEWPVVLSAEFEERFLQVPAEALVYTMKGDQKYFPVYTKEGKLTSKFIFVSNIESLNPSKIIAGNEKVIRPRLSDAEFFFKTDRKQRLADNLPKLEHILFQKELGTLRDKTERIQLLSSWIAQQIGANSDQANRAGLLSKCDLMTNMVFEFPETQGVMGMYYAQYDGEEEAVALALNEQYLPRFATDTLPTTAVSCALSLADKLDTLVGIFGIGQHPKGDKDPFALRRAALGVIKICVEKAITLNLDQAIAKAIQLYGSKLTNNIVATEVFDFIIGRLPAWYQEQGYQIDTIQAVTASRPVDLLDFDARVKAVTQFRQLPAAESLSAANKRVANILNKNPLETTILIDVPLLKLKEEIALAANIAVLKTTLAPLFAANNYEQALNELANLQDPVNAFFEHVMVMDDDLAIRNNRLALLTELHNLFLHIADIALLQPEH